MDLTFALTRATVTAERKAQGFAGAGVGTLGPDVSSSVLVSIRGGHLCAQAKVSAMQRQVFAYATKALQSSIARSSVLVKLLIPAVVTANAHL